MASKRADVEILREAGIKAPGEGIDLGGTQFVVTTPEEVDPIEGNQVTVVVYFTDNNNTTGPSVVISQTLDTETSGKIAADEKFELDGSYFPDPTNNTVQPDFDGDITAIIFYTKPATP